MKYTETESLKLQIRKLETLRQRDERELKRQKTYIEVLTKQLDTSEIRKTKWQSL
jgi:hypothetical protein